MPASLNDQPSAGRFAASAHRFPVRVYFEDTDITGMVYHANYLRYLERARSDLLRLAGIDQRARHEAGGGAYAVTRIDCRYLAPARLDDALLVVSRLMRVGAASVGIHQAVRRDATMLCDAQVTAALVSAKGRPTRHPAAWRAAFARLIETGETSEC